MSPQQPTVFISYSHDDEAWKDRLVKHLEPLRQQGLLHEVWRDRSIAAGAQWEQEIFDGIDASSVALFLVSANSLGSDYIMQTEAPRLLERWRDGRLRIVPVLLEPCLWEAVDWLKTLQMRPVDAKELSGFDDHGVNEALASLAKEVWLLVRGAGQRAEAREWVAIPPDAISIARLPVTGEELVGRELEIELLDGAWADPDTLVLSVVAWGGVGKSALVNEWLALMAVDRYRGAERVYGWSFYSQGSSERQASADQFIDRALRDFGDQDATAGSPWDKGERLARLVRRQPTLLVLDGVEPLQYPPGPQEGRLKDPALQSLLRELAAHNPGLCLVTTRQAVTDLASHRHSTAPRLDLEHLSPRAGAALLERFGVKGTAAELRAASVEFGGHALALVLLGTYLRDLFSGDVGKRGEVELLDPEVGQGGHAMRVMASYENWLGEGPELTVLRILGLFDRPADAGSLTALRAAPPIPGLTDALDPDDDRQWNLAVSRLRHARLLVEAETGDASLDAHPLVRTYFGDQLQHRRAEAWRAGHDRLFEHLRTSAPELPDTLEEMAPLYAAVVHGCCAGRHQEAYSEILKRRIHRGIGVFYSAHKLGAFGTELAALAGFFEPPRRRTVAGLDEGDRGSLLNLAGYHLRALGRLAEAVEPMEAALESRTAGKNWKHAALDAGNLSELHLALGDLRQAVAFAERSVELADRSGHAFQRMVRRTTLGDAVRHAGRVDDAAALFREAEALQAERQPQNSFLFSLRGYQYCDLLLGRMEPLAWPVATGGDLERIREACREVRRRASETIKIAEDNRRLLDIALDHLTLGRAHLGLADPREPAELATAAEHLARAVDGLRLAGQATVLPRGLLARAALHRVRSHATAAETDLGEALEIAERSGMKLFVCDAHLEWTRLDVDRGKLASARGHFETAKGIVEATGYHRRDREVEVLERVLREREAASRGGGG